LPPIGFITGIATSTAIRTHPIFGRGIGLLFCNGSGATTSDWMNWKSYDAARDWTSRSDLVWIDRHWFGIYLVGLVLPALAGALIGGTAYDALAGFLWAGLFRHFFGLHVTFAINTIGHMWGRRDFDTPDHSRNVFLLGLLGLGDGWHNNHHAFPYSARHGLHWWQFDPTWYMIRLMERVGLARDVKRPKLAGAAEKIGRNAAA
jgi:stearoyl-CoA desaturase (delta-9 desaturase)